MRIVIQRVSQASVSIAEKVRSSISSGILILLGIEGSDNDDDIQWLCSKITNLRIFPDVKGVMNLSIKDVNAEILVVSQFTLHASTRKGNRPSYVRAAGPVFAIPMYEKFIRELERESGISVKTGEFGAKMDVSLINDGPVTIIIDSKLRE